MIYDTNFLVALQGRQKGITANQARAWASENDAGTLYLPRIAVVEFLAVFATDAEAEPICADSSCCPSTPSCWMKRRA